jgi:hypothetical protein
MINIPIIAGTAENAWKLVGYYMCNIPLIAGANGNIWK